MTLGDCIKEYRENNDLSQRQFAEMCGLSNAYISVLEKNINPKTKEAPAPTFGVYKKVASAMGISVDILMEKANESEVSIGSSLTYEIPFEPISPEIIQMISQAIDEKENAKEKDLVHLFNTMTNTDKDKLLDYARYIVDAYKRADKRRK